MAKLQLEAGRLPALLEEIAGLTNPEIAVALARRWGGGRLYIPERVAPNHVLARTIGLKAAQILSRHYAPDRLDIPKASTYLNWFDARRLRSEGKTVAAIARALRLTETRVKDLLRGFDPGAALVAETEEPEKCPVCGHKKRHQMAVKPADNRQLNLDFPVLDGRAAG